MTRARKEIEAKVDAALATIAMLGFSLLVAFLAPHYATWFGTLPPFSARYLAYWPAWIAINGLALAVNLLVKAMQLDENEGAFWRKLDLVLSLASALVFLVGIVVLVMPLLHLGKPH